MTQCLGYEIKELEEQILINENKNINLTTNNNKKNCKF